MAQVIRSGAFLQQCWSVHPLCVAVKRITDEGAVVLSCSSCQSVHQLKVSTISSKDPSAHRATEGDRLQDAEAGEALLKACVSMHHAALSLRQMDVFQDLVLLRCADCRRHYELAVSAFETRQK
ncbi:MAG: hypothetical protein QM706_06825 [Nitrospira sp.]